MKPEDWKALALEQARVLKNLDSHFSFSHRVEPHENFAQCFDYGGSKLDQLNTVFDDATRVIGKAQTAIESTIIPFPEEAEVA